MIDVYESISNLYLNMNEQESAKIYRQKALSIKE